MFAKDHSLAMANRSWGRSGARTRPFRTGRSERAAPERTTNLGREEVRQRRGNLLSAMVSGRAGRSHRFIAHERGMVLRAIQGDEFRVTGNIRPSKALVVKTSFVVT